MKLILDIDPDNLEQEWLDHAKMFYYWSQKSAEASAEVDRIKSCIEVEKADQSQKAREYPATLGIEKVTETAIADFVNSRKHIADLKNELVEAKKAYQYAVAAEKALEHKRTALSKLTDFRIIHEKNANPRECQEYKESDMRKAMSKRENMNA